MYTSNAPGGLPDTIMQTLVRQPNLGALLQGASSSEDLQVTFRIPPCMMGSPLLAILHCCVHVPHTRYHAGCSVAAELALPLSLAASSLLLLRDAANSRMQGAARAAAGGRGRQRLVT